MTHKLLKFEDIASKRYYIAWDWQSGTWLIFRRADWASTYRFVCSEGAEIYRELKMWWRSDTEAFDEMCASYTFHPEEELSEQAREQLERAALAVMRRRSGKRRRRKHS